MISILTNIQMVTGVIMTLTILLQHRGSGLGGAFGGSDLAYRSRRGIEKLLFRLTILSAAIFVTSAIITLIIR